MSTRLEERRIGAGHWHIEGHCAVREGRTWAVVREGCQMRLGTGNPREFPAYRSSLAMVRDYLWVLGLGTELAGIPDGSAGGTGHG